MTSHHHICVHCGTTFPLDGRSVVSRHHTSEGLVVYARCPWGHLGVARLGRTRPVVPSPRAAA